MAWLDSLLGRGEWSVVASVACGGLAVRHLPQRGAATIATGLSEARAVKLADHISALNSSAARHQQFDALCARYPVASDAPPETWDPTQ